MEMTVFEATASGQIIALRSVLAALVMSHPEPAELQAALRETLQRPGALYGDLPAPIQAHADRVLADFSALIASRIR